MNYDEKLAVTKLNTYYQQNKVDEGKPEYDVITNIVNRIPSFTANCTFHSLVTQGIASSKNEAKRIAACKMLNLLHDENPSKFLSPKKQPFVEAAAPPSIRLEEEFDQDRLNVHLEEYLETRQTNLSQFNREFVKNLSEKLIDHFDDIDAGFKQTTSPKSSTLEKIRKTGFNVVTVDNAPLLFKKIIQEMELQYYCEFVETAQHDGYALVIKINFNLFTVCGVGRSPKDAIGHSCENAIEYLLVFNT